MLLRLGRRERTATGKGGRTKETRSAAAAEGAVARRFVFVLDRQLSFGNDKGYVPVAGLDFAVA